MNGYTIITPGNSNLYWKELIEFSEPVVNLGAYLMSIVPLAPENEKQQALQNFYDQLEQSASLFGFVQINVEHKLLDPFLKERGREILGMKELLEEYRLLQSPGLLDYLVTYSATNKRKLFEYIEQTRYSKDYQMVNFGLLCPLLALRMAVFCLYNKSEQNIRKAVRQEVSDFMGVASIGMKAVGEIGTNRITFDTDKGVDWEDGLKNYSTIILKILLDGNLKHEEEFSSNKPVELQKEVRRKIEEHKQASARAALKPYQDCYDQAVALSLRGEPALIAQE